MEQYSVSLILCCYVRSHTESRNGWYKSGKQFQNSAIIRGGGAGQFYRMANAVEIISGDGGFQYLATFADWIRRSRGAVWRDCDDQLLLGPWCESPNGETVQ